MKTTIEIPDALFREVKSKAGESGQTLEELIIEALREKLARADASASRGEHPWMSGFGELRQLHAETRRIQARIDKEFDAIEPDIALKREEW